MKKKTQAVALLSLLPMAAAAQRYNIVYIMTDDHTAQMMSCYDKSHISTPNLDRIARDGVKFVNSYVANSLSGPSRACMLTGKHSHNNGFTNNEHGIFDGSVSGTLSVCPLALTTGISFQDKVITTTPTSSR